MSESETFTDAMLIPQGEGVMSPRLPSGWKPAGDGTVACPHRDLFVCAKCDAEHPEVVNVYEAFFWIPDDDDRTALSAELQQYQS